MKRRVAVVGAGLVGICTALELARRGYETTLIDRSAPGSGASRWNAGVLANSSLVPLNNPALFRQVPALLIGRQPGFRIPPGDAHRTLPWAVRFLANARSSRCEPAIRALRALIAHSHRRHAALEAETGASFICKRGWLALMRGPEGALRARAHADRLAARDVAAVALDAGGIRALEPALGGPFTGGVHITKSAFAEPSVLLEHYLSLARRLGVDIRRRTVLGLGQAGGGLAIETSDHAPEHFGIVVVSAGAWSGDLLRPQSVRLPMMVERGYLQTLAIDPERKPTRPFHDVDGGYVASPRARGVQISTGTELATLASPTSGRPMRAALRHARQVLPLGAPAEPRVVVGNRPTLPDSLPVIGPVAHVPGLWLACGHQHIGFSTSAGTGELLAAMIDHEEPAIDMRPFRADRF